MKIVRQRARWPPPNFPPLGEGPPRCIFHFSEPALPKFKVECFDSGMCAGRTDDMTSRSGICCLCGLSGPLSFEHVPPKAAFNRERIFTANSESILEFGSKAVRGRYDQKGAGGFTLCERCNNGTGKWYVPSYVEWARQGMQYLMNRPSGYSLALPFKIVPLSVIKQIVCMFASACGPSFCQTNSYLRKFVLDRECNGLPPAIRIYCYFLDPKSSMARQSGVTGILDSLKGGANTYTFSEIAFRPFGYLMTFDSLPIDRHLQDITHFAESNPKQSRQMHLSLPIREINTPFPGDFRSREEIDNLFSDKS